MDRNFYRAIGRRVADLRRMRGLTQERLAELADITGSYVALIETGARKPTLEVLGKISGVVQVPMWRLLVDDVHGGAEASHPSTRRLSEAAHDRQTSSCC